MYQDIRINKSLLDFRVYLRKWYYYLISMIIILSFTKMFIDNRPLNFQASAKILVKSNNPNNSKLDDAAEASGSISNLSKPNLENEIEMLKSIKPIESVISKLHCNTVIKERTLFGEREFYNDLIFNNLVFKSIKDSSEYYKISLSKQNNDWVNIVYNGKKYQIKNNTLFKVANFSLRVSIDDKFSKKEILIYWNPTSYLAKATLSRLSAKTISDNSSVISLSLLDNIEQRDTLLLNAIIDEYQKENLNIKNRNLENSISFLDDRINEIKFDLGKLETQIKDYKTSNKVYNIKDQSTSDEALSVADKNKLEQLTLKEMICNQILDYTNNPSKKYSLIPSSLGLEDATLLEMIRLYNTNALLREDILKETEPKNNAVKIIENRLNSLVLKINENIENIKKSLRLSIKQTEGEYGAMQNNLSSLPEKERELTSIERLQAIKEKLYLYLLQKKEELNLSLAGSESNSYVIQTANIENQLGASESTLWSASILLALMLPTLIIYLSVSLYQKILNKSDVEYWKWLVVLIATLFVFQPKEEQEEGDVVG